MKKAVTVILISVFLNCPVFGYLRADINRDGQVNFLDLAILAEEWLSMANKHLNLTQGGSITVPDDDAIDIGSGDFSVCFWAKTEYSLTIQKPSSTTGGYWEVRVSDDLSFYIQDNMFNEESAGTYLTPLSYDKTEWNHFAVVIDRSTQRAMLYVNGDTDGLASVDISGIGTQNNANDLKFLAYQNDCSVDDIRIYKKVLTESHIRVIYNRGYGCKYTGSDAQGGIASAAWNMDEGEGDTITDAVGGLIGTFSYSGVSWADGGIPFEQPDPFTEVYEKLWDLIETDTALANYIYPGNRIKLNTCDTQHDKKRKSTKDLPELRISPAGGKCEIKRTNTSMPVTQKFAVELKTGDLRIDRSFFPIKFALLNRLTGVTGNLGLPFVRHVTLDDITDSRNDEGSDGWSTAFEINVEMWFKIV